MVRRPAALALATILVLGACGDDDDATDGAEREEPTALELTPETTTTTMPDDTALADALIEEAPPGYARADTVMGTGPLDLEGAAAAEADVEAERALLETRGFRQGWTRAWLTSDDDVVYVAVYELASEDAAALYLQDGTDTLLARGAEPFEVPEVPGARGYTTVDESAAGTFTAYAVAFTRGPRWFLVLNGSSAGGASPDTVRGLAEAQARRAEEAS